MQNLIITTFLAILLMVCDTSVSQGPVINKNYSLNVGVSLMYQEGLVNCKDGLLGFQIGKEFIRVEYFAFYLHGFEVTQNDNQSLVQLDENVWQSNGTALIKFDSGCNQNPTLRAEVSNQTIRATLPQSFINKISQIDNQATALKFKIGVPFEQNHLNPLVQDSPMNVSNMFWSWRNGYKFIRLDMSSNKNGFAFHLGSIGCQSSSSVRSPKSPCSVSNVIDTSVQLTEPLRPNDQNELPDINITVNLDALLMNSQIQREDSCMFNGIQQQEQCQKLVEPLHKQLFFSSL
ncbi:MbnP family copper-binding protein [Paraglaciecola sp.]|uniref:MbnP family copper-binding protein n=1 Tax=Paraglaciecola sp. TaxID=1920173 RepID=UPI003EFAAE54